jgi:hypothetical protein
MHPQGPPPAPRNNKPDGLVSVGWVMFGVGLFLGVMAFGSTEAGTSGIESLTVAAIVATPLTIAGAVIAAAGHLLRGR